MSTKSSGADKGGRSNKILFVILGLMAVFAAVSLSGVTLLKKVLAENKNFPTNSNFELVAMSTGPQEKVPKLARPSGLSLSGKNGPVDTTDMIPVSLPGVDRPTDLSMPKMANLSFASSDIEFEGTDNHYFENIGGSGSKMGLSISDASTLRLAVETSDIAKNGDTCAFWMSSGLGSGSTTLAMDFSENPVQSLTFMLYHVDVLTGGDKITVRARTDSGKELANPKFTFIGNAPNSDTYDPQHGEADVKVEFAPHEEDAIKEVTLKWEASNPTESVLQSIGLGEISYTWK